MTERGDETVQKMPHNMIHLIFRGVEQIFEVVNEIGASLCDVKGSLFVKALSRSTGAGFDEEQSRWTYAWLCWRVGANCVGDCVVN